MEHSLNIEVDRTYRLVICRPVGLFDAESTRQLLRFLLAFEDSTPESFNRLLDLTRGTEIRLTGPEIYEYAKARCEATASLSPFRTAIIVPPDPAAEEVAL